MSEVALSAPAMPLSRRIIGIYTAPRAVFEYLRDSPRVLGALVVVCVVALAATVPITNIIIQEQTAKMQAKPNMTPEALSRATQVMKITVPITGVIGNIVIVLVLAAIYLFMANIILGGSTNYKRMMAGVAHVSLIGVLSSIVRVPLILAKQNSQVTLSPAVFLPAEQSKTFLYHLLSQCDVFAIWMLGLSALAISVLAGVPTKKATTAVVILWIVLMPIFALLQTKFGGGS
ncbi:MAG TPA: Yip1 family protein [Dongiaceae bacterium]|nr:Yip1 family protein [Dongiaceae bacterium]